MLLAFGVIARHERLESVGLSTKQDRGDTMTASLASVRVPAPSLQAGALTSCLQDGPHAQWTSRSGVVIVAANPGKPVTELHEGERWTTW